MRKDQVIELDWEDRELKNIPDSVLEYPYLYRLSLENNEISDIPGTMLSKIPRLEELLLKGNYLESINSSIKELKTLRILDLSENELVELAPEVGDLPLLEELILNENQLAKLPNGIGNLKMLRKLDISNNLLELLPDSLLQLDCLKELYLTNNKLKKFPLLPKSLERLYMSFCLTTEVTSVIGSLHDLVNLRLCGNKLTLIPDEITRLTKLEYLDLSNNTFRSIPSGKYLEHIKFLNLSKCPLAAFPELKNGFPKLENLLVKYTKLKYFPNSFCNLPNLKGIYLQYSLIHELPGGLKEATALEEINLSNCIHLKKLPQFIFDLPNLEALHISNNMFNTEVRNQIKLNAIERNIKIFIY